MKIYRALLGLMLVVMMLSGLACGGGGDDDNDNDNDLAPDSVAGRSYQVTVNTGTGLFAATGTATLAFNADGTYTTSGADTNILEDNGTYTETKLSADTVQIVLNSAVVAEFQGATYIFTYTGDQVGSFTASLNGDTQAGTFREL